MVNDSQEELVLGNLFSEQLHEQSFVVVVLVLVENGLEHGKVVLISQAFRWEANKEFQEVVSVLRGFDFLNWGQPEPSEAIALGWIRMVVEAWSDGHQLLLGNFASFDLVEELNFVLL